MCSLQGGVLQFSSSHPRRAPEASCHQQQKSSHLLSFPLVFIVGGNLMKHLLEPPFQAEHARQTQGRATNTMNPSSEHGRDVRQQRQRLLAPAACSVGIDYWGQPPSGASPPSEARSANKGTRNTYRRHHLQGHPSHVHLPGSAHWRGSTYVIPKNIVQEQMRRRQSCGRTAAGCG